MRRASCRRSKLRSSSRRPRSTRRSRPFNAPPRPARSATAKYLSRPSSIRCASAQVKQTTTLFEAGLVREGEVQKSTGREGEFDDELQRSETTSSIRLHGGCTLHGDRTAEFRTGRGSGTCTYAR